MAKIQDPKIDTWNTISYDSRYVRLTNIYRDRFPNDTIKITLTVLGVLIDLTDESGYTINFSDYAHFIQYMADSITGANQ